MTRSSTRISLGIYPVCQSLSTLGRFGSLAIHKVHNKDGSGWSKFGTRVGTMLPSSFCGFVVLRLKCHYFPGHNKTYGIIRVPSNDSDQHVPHSLIKVLAVRMKPQVICYTQSAQQTLIRLHGFTGLSRSMLDARHSVGFAVAKLLYEQII